MDSRKAFNFYRSYWDVAQQLNDKDRLSFYEALFTRQFTGNEIELDGMAKFAYISQKHNIDSQVIGYIKKLGIEPPTVPPMQPPTVPPSVQEEEKVEEKEKDIPSTKVEPINFDILLKTYNEIFGKNCRVITDRVKRSYNARLKENFTKPEIHRAMLNVAKDKFHIENNFKYATIEFFSRADKLNMYANLGTTIETKKENKNFGTQYGVW